MNGYIEFIFKSHKLNEEGRYLEGIALCDDYLSNGEDVWRKGSLGENHRNEALDRRIRFTNREAEARL